MVKKIEMLPKIESARPPPGRKYASDKTFSRNNQP
jgi:hypothetical protein